jgi:hypothetical protein
MNSLKPLALACAIAFAIPFAAHADDAVPPPSSSPVRAFPAPTPCSRSAPPSSPDEIRSAGVNDVNAAIRKIGGVFGRQSLDSSPDFALDLRGFGTNGAQNMVIMVDGVRLNENELASAVLSTIPIDTVERIEIVARRQQRAVWRRRDRRRDPDLHHAPRGASGHARLGVCRRRPVRERDCAPPVARGRPVSVRPGRGAPGQRQLPRQQRLHAEQRQRPACRWASRAAALGVRVESARQDSRLPGSLTLAQFRPIRARPRPRTTSARSTPTASTPLPNTASARSTWPPSCRTASAKPLSNYDFSGFRRSHLQGPPDPVLAARAAGWARWRHAERTRRRRRPDRWKRKTRPTIRWPTPARNRRRCTCATSCASIRRTTAAWRWARAAKSSTRTTSTPCWACRTAMGRSRRTPGSAGQLSVLPQ